MPLAGLELKPGQNLVGDIGRFHPGELAGNCQSPEESDVDDEQQDGGRARLSSAAIGRG